MKIVCSPRTNSLQNRTNSLHLLQNRNRLFSVKVAAHNRHDPTGTLSLSTKHISIHTVRATNNNMTDMNIHAYIQTANMNEKRECIVKLPFEHCIRACHVVSIINFVKNVQKAGFFLLCKSVLHYKRMYFVLCFVTSLMFHKRNWIGDFLGLMVWVVVVGFVVMMDCVHRTWE